MNLDRERLFRLAATEDGCPIGVGGLMARSVFKVLVCGGRDFTRRDALYRYLDQQPMALDGVVTGGARGADTLAEEWARNRGIPCAVVKADWSTYGRKAGPIRNQLMLDTYPTLRLVVAFDGGRGTEDMLRRARKAKLAVVHFSWPSDSKSV